MSRLVDILKRVSQTGDCSLVPATGQPVVRDGDHIPEDLKMFYSLAGGARLFDCGMCPMRVVEPREFVRANPVIVRTEAPEDITDSWYIVAREGEQQFITIDCSARRLGRCYDSFWDRHGIVGSCPVIALTFTELLQRLLDNHGGHPYWLNEEFSGYGDAYDD